jgi:hypothetical protein
MRHRQILLIAALLAAFGLSALQTSAQTQTLVTGQVLDPNSVPYSGARLVITLNNPGPGQPSYTPCSNPVGCPIQLPGPITLDDQGNIPGGGIPLYANSSISVNGVTGTTTYNFQVNENPGALLPWGTGPQIFTLSNVTIAGTSQVLTSAFTAVPPPALTLFGSATGGGGGGSGAAIKPTVGDGIFYVTTEGSDANDCRSWGTACATINGAETNMPSNGGTVLVGTGTFVGQAILSKPTALFCNGYAGPSELTIGTAANTSVVSITSSNVRVTGCLIDGNGFSQSFGGAGVSMDAAGLTTIEIDHDTIQNTFLDGVVSTQGSVTGLTVHQNTIQNIGLINEGGAGAAPTIVQQNISANGDTNASTFTVSTTSNVTAGNTGVACFTDKPFLLASEDITDSQGNSWDLQTNSRDETDEILCWTTTFSASGPETVTFALADALHSGVEATIVEVAGSIGLDNAGDNGPNDSTSNPQEISSGVTTTAENDLVLAFAGSNQVNGDSPTNLTYTAFGTFAIAQQTINNFAGPQGFTGSAVLLDQTVANPSFVTPQVSTNATVSYRMAFVALKGTPNGGTQTEYGVRFSQPGGTSSVNESQQIWITNNNIQAGTFFTGNGENSCIGILIPSGQENNIILFQVTVAANSCDYGASTAYETFGVNMVTPASNAAMENVVISGNNFLNDLTTVPVFGTVAININGSVESPVISGNSALFAPALALMNESGAALGTNATVTGNDFSGSGGDVMAGVTITSSSNNIVSDNTIGDFGGSGAGAIGINITNSASNANCLGVNVFTSVTTPISDSGTGTGCPNSGVSSGGGVQPDSTTCTMLTSVSVPASTLTPVLQCVVTMPTTGGPWHVLASYNVYTLSSNVTADSNVTDGTIIFATNEVESSGSFRDSQSGTALSPATYANGASVTFTVQIESSGALTAEATPAITGQNSWLNVVVLK